MNHRSNPPQPETVRLFSAVSKLQHLLQFRASVPIAMYIIVARQDCPCWALRSVFSATPERIQPRGGRSFTSLVHTRDLGLQDFPAVQTLTR